VRHGETQWNKEFRLQGRLDSPLTDKGKQQADENGRLLRRQGVQRLLVSPLGRTTETAHIINSHAQATIDYFDALVERDSGRWSGLTFDEIRTAQPLAWRAREADEWGYRPPGGENLPDVIARVRSLLETTRAAMTAHSPVTAIISHGVVGKAILAHYLQLEDKQAALVRQPNDVVYSLSFSDVLTPPDCEYFKRGEGPFDNLVSSKLVNTGGVSGQ
jgi:probable phosphoglycerate mutase